MRTKKIHAALVFCALFTLIAFQVSAWRFEGSGTVTLADYGVRITRPNDRWRVLEPQYPALVEMRFLRSSENVVLTLKDAPQTNRKKWSVRGQAAETSALLEPYRGANWRFFKTSSDETTITAEATNSERKILLLRFWRKADPKHERGFFVLEMAFPRELYLDMKPAFEAAGSSFTQSNRL